MNDSNIQIDKMVSEDIGAQECGMLLVAMLAQAVKDQDLKYFQSKVFEEHILLMPSLHTAPYLNNPSWWLKRVKLEIANEGQTDEN